MDNPTNVQKRKRAIIVPNNTIIVDTRRLTRDPDIDDEFDDGRYRLPANEEEDSNASDVDQPDNKPLTKSTLFWPGQLIIKRQEDDELGLRKPSLVDLIQDNPNILRKIFIIKLINDLY
jgi:hypothetical protein